MRILITNDDGIEATGLDVLEKIATDLTDSVVTILVDSNDNKTYFAQVGSSVVLFNRTVTNGKVVVRSCLQIKSAAKAYCTRTTSDIKKTLPNSPTGPTGPTGR